MFLGISLCVIFQLSAMLFNYCGQKILQMSFFVVTDKSAVAYLM